MNRTLLIALFATGGFCGIASAQTTADLKIKQPSIFKVPAGTRSPFWKLGFKDPSFQKVAVKAGSPAVPAIESLLKPEFFVVTSISTGSMPVAVINGRIYAEGELIPLSPPGLKPVAAQVFAIRDGHVILRYQDKTMTIFQKGMR